MSVEEMKLLIEIQHNHISDLQDMLRDERKRNNELRQRLGMDRQCSTVRLVPLTK